MANSASKISCDRLNELDTIKFGLVWPKKLGKLSFTKFGLNYSIFKKYKKIGW